MKATDGGAAHTGDAPPTKSKQPATSPALMPAFIIRLSFSSRVPGIRLLLPCSASPRAFVYPTSALTSMSLKEAAAKEKLGEIPHDAVLRPLARVAKLVRCQRNNEVEEKQPTADKAC